jgi:hypothetical protein
MNSVPNYYTLETSTKALINFFADATALSNGDNEFYLAQQECTLARYALRDRVLVYDTLKEFLQKQAKENPKEAFLLLSKLDVAADKLVQTVERVVSLLKKAAEIDILSSTRFDGVQLFHVVQQIPVIIVSLLTAVLEVQLELFSDSIFSSILEELGTASKLNGQAGKLEKIQKQIKEHIPVFAASVAKEVGERLSEELQSKLKVVTINNGEGGSGNSAAAVTLDQVNGMVSSVPTVE